MNEAFIKLPFKTTMMNHAFLEKMGFIVVDEKNRKVLGCIHSGNALMLRNEDSKKHSPKIIAKIREKRIVHHGCFEKVELKVTAYNMPHELFKKVYYDFIETPEGKAAKEEVARLFAEAGL